MPRSFQPMAAGSASLFAPVTVWGLLPRCSFYVFSCSCKTGQPILLFDNAQKAGCLIFWGFPRDFQPPTMAAGSPPNLKPRAFLRKLRRCPHEWLQVCGISGGAKLRGKGWFEGTPTGTLAVWGVQMPILTHTLTRAHTLEHTPCGETTVLATLATLWEI